MNLEVCCYNINIFCKHCCCVCFLLFLEVDSHGFVDMFWMQLFQYLIFSFILTMIVLYVYDVLS